MLRSLSARLSLAYVALIVAALALLTALLIATTQDFTLQELRRQLRTDARLVAEIAAPLWDGDVPALDALAKRLGQDTGARITLIQRDGVVLGDSDLPPAQLDNHAGRPEVAQALASGSGEAVRRSDSSGQSMIYSAWALRRGAETAGVVRVAVPLNTADSARAQIAGVMLPGGVLISLLAIATALLIARRTTDSLAHLRRIADRLAAGDLSARARTDLPAEAHQLASTMNQMAERLQETIGSLRAERARLDAILARMADGLLLVDAGDIVTQINPEAQRILNTGAAQAIGRSFTQVARDHELTACLHAARASGREAARVVEQAGSRRFLRMVATPQPSEGSAPVFLILLQDLTELRRLETVRREFISNISHELRTPLAALQALAETLADGALDDPPAARRFVARIEDEVSQLHALLNDLLDLSAMESGRTPLRLEPADIGGLVRRAAQRLQPQAERAGVRLSADSTPAVRARVDSARIEQVLINLIHNAIKFTPAGGEIECRVGAHEQHVTVSVRDSGVGISAEALPRVFERFYKGDKARGGGGTGLGLAIAKHIVELHGGAIWVESVEGRGATFLFTLPLGEPVSVE